MDAVSSRQRRRRRHMCVIGSRCPSGLILRHPGEGNTSSPLCGITPSVTAIPNNMFCISKERRRENLQTLNRKDDPLLLMCGSIKTSKSPPVYPKSSNENIQNGLWRSRKTPINLAKSSWLLWGGWQDSKEAKVSGIMWTHSSWCPWDRVHIGQLCTLRFMWKTLP